MAIKFFAFFFPTISTFGCFWSQWPTSLAVTSGREGVRTTSFKPWRPHRGSCRGATAIEENNGSRREQWLTSLTVWTVHSICTYMIFIYIYRRCGAGGCRREATWIYGHHMKSSCLIGHSSINDYKWAIRLYQSYVELPDGDVGLKAEVNQFDDGFW